MSSAATFHRGIYRSSLVLRMVRWLDAMPHPSLAIEIAADHVAAARSGRGGSVDGYFEELLAPGTIAPSAVEPNVVNPVPVKAAIAEACDRLRAREEDVALILPDPVIRVFIQHFEEFPRSPDEAIPILRWKLKKSIPFEADETVISYMRQAPRDSGVDVLTALARLRIIREYEALVEGAGLRPGVVLSSSLVAIALLDAEKPTLLARVSGSSLTTAIVRKGMLCGYRCTDLPAAGSALSPQMLLEEVFPVAAYYQDTWHEGIESVRISGLGSRLPDFIGPLEAEFHCEVRSLVHPAAFGGLIKDDARPLVDRELDGLVGWLTQRG